VGLYVIANRKGRPISIDVHADAWQAAVRLAKVPNAHFHDIRAKYATDAKRLGLDYQSGLGHRSLQQSERYVKRRETIIAPTLPRKVSR
jgi:integrase